MNKPFQLVITISHLQAALKWFANVLKDERYNIS